MNKGLLLFLLFGTLLITGCTETVMNENQATTVLAEISSRTIKDASFEFPTIQWEMYETHEQKLAACQIPDSILSDIPTDELVKICMNYPLILDAYAFNSPAEGLKKVISRFNGFQELMSRSDNCYYVFKYLKDNDIREINFAQMTDVETGRFTLLYSLAEYLLSSEDVIRNITESMKVEIITFISNILEYKEANNQHYALSGLASSVYLWLSTLNIGNVQSRSANETVSRFMETDIIPNMESYREIKKQCQTLK